MTMLTNNPEGGSSVLEETKISKKRSPLSWVLVAGTILILGAGGYVLFQRRTERSTKQAGTPIKQQEEIRALVERVGKHLPVNEKETPLIAIVTDVNAAKQQSPVFYKKATNGDRLIVWSDKAVLYSPERDEVESVLMFQAATSSPALVAEHATVEVRNGSGVVGLTAPLAEKLRSQGLTVSKVTTTRVKEIYAKTLVTNISSRPLPLSAKILGQFGMAVASTTVSAEAPVAADFLIILGKNDITKYQK